VWHAAREALSGDPLAWHSFSNELVWREFTHSTLRDFPDVLKQPLRPAWRDFPYRGDEAAWQAWASGTTGYPVVDAAMRQLLGEGFVHNRARMIAASFLTKHLLLDYRRGEQHYLELLVDGDWAQNNAGWQWSAGSGLDAQPYFRVFNPTAQGERFDPEGEYVKRWVPELRRVPPRFIHRPNEAPADVLRDAGVTLGVTYPRPIVDHGEARARFLAIAEAHTRRGRG
jgi:deoxyribodipyrimidine photo-lyase